MRITQSGKELGTDKFPLPLGKTARITRHKDSRGKITYSLRAGGRTLVRSASLEDVVRFATRNALWAVRTF